MGPVVSAYCKAEIKVKCEKENCYKLWPFVVEMKLKLAAVQMNCIKGYLDLCNVMLPTWGWIKQIGDGMKVKSASVSEIVRMDINSYLFLKMKKWKCESWNESKSGRSTNELHWGPVKFACCQFGLNN